MNLKYSVGKMPSNYFSRLQTAIRKSVVVGKESGIQDSAEVLIGQGKLWFGGSRFFHSVNRSICSNACSGIALASSSQLLDKKRTLSVVDTLSRTFSVPSVSGPSVQVCGYHIDRALSGPDKFSAAAKFQIKTMAARLPGIAVGECSLDNLTLKRGWGLPSTKNSGNVFLRTGVGNGGKVSMNLKNHHQPDNRAIFGYFVCNVAKSWRNSSCYKQLGSGDFHSSSTSCYSVGPVHDVPFDTSAQVERLTNSADSSEQYVISL